MAVIAALPAEQRVTLVLCHVEGLSYREVAAILEVSEAVVRGRLSRARRAAAGRVAGLGVSIDLSDRWLACGADADDLLAQVAGGRAGDRSPHQRHCPHCQAALAEYDRLWSPVREVAATKVHAEGDPGECVAPDSRRRGEPKLWVAHRGRRDRPDRRSGRGCHRPRGRRACARGAGRAVPRRRHRLEWRSTVDAGVAGASTAIELTLSADYGEDVHALAQRIRVEVSEQVRALTGLDPVGITVVIDDVFPRVAAGTPGTGMGYDADHTTEGRSIM